MPLAANTVERLLVRIEGSNSVVASLTMPMTPQMTGSDMRAPLLSPERSIVQYAAAPIAA